MGYGSFLFWYMNNQYDRVVEQSKVVGTILGQDIAKFVFLNELSAAADISSKLKTFLNLNKMVLYKLDEKPIYQYSIQDKNFKAKEFSSKISRDKIDVKGNALEVFIEVSYQDTHMGYVWLCFKVETIFDVFIKNLNMALLILLFLFIISYFLAAYFAQKFTQPILKLVEYLEDVQSIDSFKKRINVDEENKYNEYGKLYNEVNTMLNRIEVSHNALKIASVAFETQSGMIITDSDGKILQSNKAFSKITGYSKEEVLGETPAILKSGLHDNMFYEEMFESLHNYNYWSGEINNRNKNGNIVTEQLIMQTVLDDNKKIAYYVASFLDITRQKETEAKLKEKESLLRHQSKMAAMGEMLANIAHQWRQPLSVISTASTGLVVSKEFKMPQDDEYDIKQLKKINNSAQYLSQTIDDFRNFFKSNKGKESFNLMNSYKKTMELVDAKFSNADIDVIETIEEVELVSLENELMQVIMNLLNNARDVLESKKDQRKLILIDIYKKDNYAVFSICDNAGGVPEDIIDRIFEPYFTTKHKSNGTGIGLYMSLEMISKNMNGDLNVYNKTYTYEGQKYKGACFTIMLPLTQES